jgi:murein DD-endopeptidase MepM/ murein hydrolase activator NlpD
MGGEISDDDTVQATPPNVDKIQRAQTAAAQEALLSNLYVQNLRTDVQKLRQKYNTQTVLTSQAVPRVDPNNTMPATTATSADKLQQKLSPPSSANQLINPEFSPNQAAKTLELERQKQRPIPVKAGEAAVRARDGLATAPLGTDATESLQYFQEQNVSPALPPLGGVDTYLPKPTSISTKGYMWPAKGRLTSPYGWRWGRMHKGIDIAAPLGTPVFASAAGVVVKAGWNSGGYGNMIDIQHADGSVTRYAHNKRILVQTGQVVQQGQQISEMGSTGFSTGPHVHFEVHPLGKQAVNPIAYLPR